MENRPPGRPNENGKHHIPVFQVILCLALTVMLLGSVVYLYNIDRSSAPDRKRARERSTAPVPEDRSVAVKPEQFRKKTLYRLFTFKPHNRSGARLEGVTVTPTSVRPDRQNIFREGDLILKINGRRIDHLNDGFRIQQIISEKNPAEFVLKRNGKRINLRVSHRGTPGGAADQTLHEH